MNDKLEHLIKNSFGFNAKESTHHFLVNIPRSTNSQVEISEHLTWDEEQGSADISYGTRPDGQIRVVLARIKWDGIADEIRAQFNQRLKSAGRKAGTWMVGPNLVSRELGKELVLLAWSIEEADPGLISIAIANWKGLVPEERWWLYTQTAAATAHGISGRGKGWRKAVRYALTENPVAANAISQSNLPEYYQRATEGPLFRSVKDSEGSQEDI